MSPRPPRPKDPRIGVFGGTFNPVHVGHLVLAENFRETFSLDRVLFVPSGMPPHKSGRFPAGRNRLHMVRLAIAGNRSFEAVDLEIRRRGPSYTVETLGELRKLHGPGTNFFFLIGMDAFKDLTTWHEASRLTSLASFVVVPRPGHPFEDPARFMPPPAPQDPAAPRGGTRRFSIPGRCSLYLADGPLLSVSSTAIRDRFRRGRSVRYLVPESVERYIIRKGLYR